MDASRKREIRGSETKDLTTPKLVSVSMTFALFPPAFLQISPVLSRGFGGCLHMWRVPLEERNIELGEPAFL